MAEILTDIEKFLAEQGMAASAFGARALGDRHFVRQLRAGRRVWPETEAKIRSFMEGYAASPPSVAVCGLCDLRADDPKVHVCTATDCGLHRRQAA